MGISSFSDVVICYAGDDVMHARAPCLGKLAFASRLRYYGNNQTTGMLLKVMMI